MGGNKTVEAGEDKDKTNRGEIKNDQQQTESRKRKSSSGEEAPAPQRKNDSTSPSSATHDDNGKERFTTPPQSPSSTPKPTTQHPLVQDTLSKTSSELKSAGNGSDLSESSKNEVCTCSKYM